ncbi:restriction endonuclease subunit S [Sporolactobacillus sp. Y61]|jgi:type I restriction enzyme S subunit|uniref:Restriction endonuclease subunit S n=1 Tax=Sporolactobacillus sp. Y61 TaxID=3160863 RepID=A0AAU8IFB4_9BACL
MAQAIFKHWFVDFEFPDENGNPYKSSGGKMIESELGRIPEGWEVVSVSEIADILSGGTPKTKIKRYWDGNIPFFTPKDARNGCYTLDTEKLITKEGLEKCNSRLYGKDTIFITARGTVGKLNLASRNMAMNQSCYAIWHKNDRQYYMLFSLRSIIKKIINNASGAVFSAINVKDFNTFKLVNAPDSIIKNFDCIVHPIFEHILALSNQNKILESVRDTLLPKLMSGEIRVPTEQMVR